jgi:hypothetical protein
VTSSRRQQGTCRPRWRQHLGPRQHHRRLHGDRERGHLGESPPRSGNERADDVIPRLLQFLTELVAHRRFTCEIEEVAEDERGGRIGAAARSPGSNKMSREATFRQNDITRALRAAGAAGCEVRRIEINRDGKIVLVLTEPADPESKADSSEIVL